jgi:trigger factor
MGTVTRENIGLLNDKITVKIEKSDYLPSFEKSLKEYGRKANIPGFRKGMVPTSLIKKMYGNSVFVDEILKSVEKKLTDYVSTEQLEIFAQPLPLPENDASQINMTQPQDYSFAFEVGLKPNFELPVLSSLHPTRYIIRVSDEMVNEEVERLRQKNGTMTEPGVVTGDDNVLNVTFQESNARGEVTEEKSGESETAGSTETQTKAEASKPKENSLLVSYFSPEFRKELTGKKNGDALTIQLSTAFEEKERNWILQDLGLSKDSPEDAAKYFHMVIAKVGLLEKAALDESFFKKVYPALTIESETAFRDQVKKDMEDQWKQQSSHNLQHTLYHELLDKTNVEFPESFLKRWLLNGGEKPKTPDEVESEYPAFTNALKWNLITDKIIQAQQIEVKPEEIREAARRQLFSYLGGLPQGGDQPWVEEYIAKMMQDRRFVEETYQNIRTNKMLDWVASQVSPADKDITAEEFNKLNEEHRHHHHE